MATAQNLAYPHFNFIVGFNEYNAAEVDLKCDRVWELRFSISRAWPGPIEN